MLELLGVEPEERTMALELAGTEGLDLEEERLDDFAELDELRVVTFEEDIGALKNPDAVALAEETEDAAAEDAALEDAEVDGVYRLNTLEPPQYCSELPTHGIEQLP